MAKANWKLMNHVLFISLAVLVVFAWWDSENLIGIKQIDSEWKSPHLWDIFWDQISPATFSMWLAVLAAIGFIYYLFTKDKSEALAIFLTPFMLIYFGVQDVIYFFFSPDTLGVNVGCWADVMTPIRIISDILGETCPTRFSFLISAGIGIFLANKVYHSLQEAKW